MADEEGDEMIIDAYNTTQNVRGRSDYLTGARPGEEPPAHVPFDPPGALLDRAVGRKKEVSRRVDPGLVIERIMTEAAAGAEAAAELTAPPED